MKNKIIILIIFFAFDVITSKAIDYNYKNIFTLAVPDEMEEQDINGDFVRRIGSKAYDKSIANSVIFQQKGLNELSNEGFKDYARIMMTHFYSSTDLHYLYRWEHPALSLDKKMELIELFCDPQTNPNVDFVRQPVFTWIEICDDTWALQIEYIRTGKESNVKVYVFLLQDMMYLVEIVMAYRMNADDNWKSKMDDAIESFRWHKPTICPSQNYSEHLQKQSQNIPNSRTYAIIIQLILVLFIILLLVIQHKK